MAYTGNFRLGPDSGRVVIKTSRAGLAAKAGHDLTIEFTRWSGQAEIPDEEAGGVTAAQITAGISGTWIPWVLAADSTPALNNNESPGRKNPTSSQVSANMTTSRAAGTILSSQSCALSGLKPEALIKLTTAP